jgi:cystathionine beta-lyase/cystathionine gamma-synthase
MPEFETQVIHAGIEPDELTGAVMTPIYQTSTYAQSSPGEHKGYEYSRTDNPTRTVLQNQLAALEQGDHALVFSSGLAASDCVLNLFQTGDHVIAGDDLYGGTYRLFEKVATYRGLKFDFIDLSAEELLRSKIRQETKLIWFETPTNPMLNVFDIRKIAAIAKEKDILVVVDNTFMSPYFQNPLTLGADIVMHSMTKYINGHSDVVMGCLVMRNRNLRAPRTTWSDPNFTAPKTLYERLKFLQNAVGATPGPFDCWLVLRGIKTLAVRMERHARNALEIAQFLEKHKRIERVVYPGLPNHPGHTLAKAQMRGFGGMITFFPTGGLPEARRFLENLKLFTLAESLGGVESLIEHPAIMTHASIPPEIRKEIGIADNLVRMSVGIEKFEDLKADLDQALMA